MPRVDPASGIRRVTRPEEHVDVREHHVSPGVVDGQRRGIRQGVDSVEKGGGHASGRQRDAHDGEPLRRSWAEPDDGRHPTRQQDRSQARSVRAGNVVSSSRTSAERVPPQVSLCTSPPPLRAGEHHWPRNTSDLLSAVQDRPRIAKAVPARPSPPLERVLYDILRSAPVTGEHGGEPDQVEMMRPEERCQILIRRIRCRAAVL
jgi:hypothetical protein